MIGCLDSGIGDSTRSTSIRWVQMIASNVNHWLIGKSSFARRYFKPHNYEIINRDTLQTQAKCLKVCLFSPLREIWIYNLFLWSRRQRTLYNKEKVLLLIIPIQVLILDLIISLLQNHKKFPVVVLSWIHRLNYVIIWIMFVFIKHPVKFVEFQVTE